MKIEKHIIEKDKTQISNQRSYEKREAINSIVPHKGHKVWEIDLTTGKAKEAEYKETNVQLNSGPKTILRGGDTTTRKTLIIKDKCYYIPALNKKTALKKFHKLGRAILDQQNKTAK